MPRSHAKLRRSLAAVAGLFLVVAAWVHTDSFQDQWVQAQQFSARTAKRHEAAPATPAPETVPAARPGRSPQPNRPVTPHDSTTSDKHVRTSTPLRRLPTAPATTPAPWTLPSMQEGKSQEEKPHARNTQERKLSGAEHPSEDRPETPRAPFHVSSLPTASTGAPPTTESRPATEASTDRPRAAHEALSKPIPWNHPLVRQVTLAPSPAGRESAPPVPQNSRPTPIELAPPTGTTAANAGSDRRSPEIVEIRNADEAAEANKSRDADAERVAPPATTELLPPANAPTADATNRSTPLESSLASPEPAAGQNASDSDGSFDDRLSRQPMSPEIEERHSWLTPPHERSAPNPIDVAPEVVPLGEVDALFPPPHVASSPDATANTWHLTLQQARRYSLENNKDICVIQQTPEQAAALVQAQEAVFDPTVVVAVQGGQRNRQVASLIDSFGGNFASLRRDFLHGDGLDTVGMVQRLRTGGLLSAGWLADYQSLDPIGSFVLKNPTWVSQWSVRLEQPLLRGAGRRANEAPILIALAEHSRAAADVRAAINDTMLSVEVAYWNAVAAHHETQVLDEIVKTAQELWQHEQQRFSAGRATDADVAQSEELYHQFRIQQLESQSRFDEAIRELLRVMAYPTNSEVSIALATPPMDLNFEPHWDLAKFRAQQRPELLAQQAAVQAAELSVQQAANGLRPDLALRLGYAATGLEENLDDSLETMARHEYSDWTVGLVYRQPLGRNADLAASHFATTQLRKEQLALDRLQHDILHQLRSAMQRVVTTRDVAQLQQKRRLSAVAQWESSRNHYAAGQLSLLDLLLAQRIASEARIAEIRAMLDFEVAIAQWQHAQGDFDECYQIEPELTPAT